MNALLARGYSPSNANATGLGKPGRIMAGSGHNEYVKALLTMGVVGLAAFLLAGYGCLRYSWLLYTRARDHFSRSLGLGMIGATSAFLAAAMTGPGLLHASIGTIGATIYFWIFLGLGLVLLKIETSRRLTGSEIATNIG